MAIWPWSWFTEDTTAQQQAAMAGLPPEDYQLGAELPTRQQASGFGSSLWRATQAATGTQGQGLLGTLMALMGPSTGIAMNPVNFGPAPFLQPVQPRTDWVKVGQEKSQQQQQLAMKVLLAMLGGA